MQRIFKRERDQESLVVLLKPICILILSISSRFMFWIFDVNCNVNSARIQHTTNIINTNIKENSSNSSNSSIFDIIRTKTRALQKYEEIYTECFKCSFNRANCMDSFLYRPRLWKCLILICIATYEATFEIVIEWERSIVMLFPYFQMMYNTRIVYHGVLLLFVTVTSTDSTKCSRIIEGTTSPRSNAVGKYDFFLTLFNRTDKVYAYMPNTRYNGKHIYSRKWGNWIISI